VNSQRYDGYCMRCFIHDPANADKPVFRNYKTKEIDVVQRVKSVFPDVSWIHDKKVENGCSKRRPDLFLDMGSHVIVVEIDEYQHRDYDPSCVNKRLMELSKDVGHRPLVVIRFNPDDYTNEDGTRVPSCWGATAIGHVRVRPCKKEEWTRRVDALNDEIRFWTTHEVGKTVEVVQLFYDKMIR